LNLLNKLKIAATAQQLSYKKSSNMKNKKTSKGCLGNVVDSILSGPIKKKKHTEELPSSVDSINRIAEQQPEKKGSLSKKRTI
jgi:hypothetical protein